MTHYILLRRKEGRSKMKLGLAPRQEPQQCVRRGQNKSQRAKIGSLFIIETKSSCSWGEEKFLLKGGEEEEEELTRFEMHLFAHNKGLSS